MLMELHFFKIWIGVQFRGLPPRSAAASVAYCTIPRFSKRSYFGRQVPLASPSSQRRNYGQEMVAKLCLGYAPRFLLQAANLRHGTDNFTSLPKEGVLRIFIAL